MSCSLKIKIAVVQLNSQIGQAKATELRAWKLLQNLSAKTSKPDIIVFPEFALTGYNFHSRKQIDPYLEDVYAGAHDKSGTNLEFATSVSKLYNCYTVLGYPSANYGNAAMVVSPLGEVVHNYKKHFTYDTDDEWGCIPGLKFESFDLMFPTANDSTAKKHVKCSIGICMDLNPEKFDETKFQDFDFASHCLEEDVQLIISPTAWLHSTAVTGSTEKDEKPVKLSNIKALIEKFPFLEEPQESVSCIDIAENSFLKKGETKGVSFEPDSPDYSTVDYWMLRFFPFLYNSNREEWSETMKKLDYLKKTNRKSYLGVTQTASWGFQGKEAILCICNRCGIEEKSTVFAGSSGIYKFNGQTSEVEQDTGEVGIDHAGVDVYGILPKGQEGILYREVDVKV